MCQTAEMLLAYMRRYWTSVMMRMDGIDFGHPVTHANGILFPISLH